jgi:hypothetical protein
MHSKHHPNGDGSSHFNNGRLQELIAAYQTGGDRSVLGEIVGLTQERAVTLIRFQKTTKYRPEDELLSDINYKLLRSVSRFDPSRGSAFTFISALIQNTLCTSVTRTRLDASRRVELDDITANKLVANSGNHAADITEDVEYRIRHGARTTLDDPAEIQTQRWFVDSFLDGAFELRRHQCANAAMRVFGLGHDRSRELYDLTMLEIRRVLYDELKRHEQITPGRLVGTRATWMLRYVPLLSRDEFTKFVFLARDLSPFILYLIDPQSRSRRQDRNNPIGRQNLLWVIHGHPCARLLF